MAVHPLAHEPLLVLRQLLSPADKDKYRSAEGNVESLFASRLLTDFAGIPAEWVYHQVIIEGGRADIAVIVNGSIVLLVECKKAAEFVRASTSAVHLRKTLNQGLGYALSSGAPLVLVTDARHLALIDRQRLVIVASSADEIVNNGSDLLRRLRPENLYYLSRNISPPPGAINATRILGEAWSRKLSTDVEVLAEGVRAEFYDEDNWLAFRDELLSWQSLNQHLRISCALHSAKQNEIIHIDHSFISYFEGAWYYDHLHKEVISSERELVGKVPGAAMRVFVLENRDQLIREIAGLRSLLHQQLTMGYRCGLLYKSDWIAAGIVDSHLDIVGNIFAKIYMEIDSVLKGDVIDETNRIRSLRNTVSDIVRRKFRSHNFGNLI